MKQQLLIRKFLWLLLVIIVPFIIQAQDPIVNGSFESWSPKTLFEHPTSWFTDVNPGTASLSTTKDADAKAGNYSLRLETVENTGVTNPVPVGYAVLGEFIYEFPPKGIPWSQMVDQFNMDVKYNIKAGDAALVWVRMTKDNNTIYNNFNPIIGVQEDSWITLTLDLSSENPVAPDSIMIGIVSSMPNELNIPIYTPIIGSWIMVDDIYFSNNGSLYPVPNYSFEDWEDYTVEEPDGWTSSNLLLTYDESTNMVKTTDAASGSFAAQLTTTPTLLSTAPIPGRLSYGTALLRAGGVPYTDTPLFFSGDYKFSPNGSDQATIEVYFNQNPDTWIAGAYINLSSANTEYEHFSLPITFPEGTTPDRVFINIQSGSNAGSVLKVDNLQLTNISTGIDDTQKDALTGLYPNPFKEVINLKNPQNVKRVTISTLSGQVVSEIMTHGAQSTLNTSALIKGQYLITLEFLDGSRSSEIMMHE